MTAHAKPSDAKVVNLALQGGGAHGAYTWGVLDRLLEDERIVIEGISATSAGAINAAALAQGLADGGTEAARKTLERFWRRVSLAASASPLQPTWLDRWFGNWNMDYSPAYLAFDLLTRTVLAESVQPARPRSPVRSAGRSTSNGSGAAPRSSCSSPPPTYAPASSRCSRPRTSRPTCSWRPPACRSSIGRWRSTGSRTGTGLHGQSRDLPSHLRLRGPGHRDRAYQSDSARRPAQVRTRDPEPGQRDQLQLLAHA